MITGLGGCIHSIRNGSTPATALTIPDDSTSQHDMMVVNRMHNKRLHVLK